MESVRKQAFYVVHSILMQYLPEERFNNIYKIVNRYIT